MPLFAEYDPDEKDVDNQLDEQEEAQDEETGEEDTIEEGGEGVDEDAEAQDQGEDIDGEDQDDDQDDDSRDDDDNLIPIVYKDANGNEVQEDMDYDEVANIIGQFKNGDFDVGEYQKAIRSSAPLVRAFRDSKLMQNIYQYYLQGYSDDIILKNAPIFKGMGNQQEVENTEDDISPEGVFDKNSISQMVKEALQQELQPLQDQLKEVQQQKYMEESAANSINHLENALGRYELSLDALNDTEKGLVFESIQDALPNVDINSYPLSQKQAYIIVKDAVDKINRKKQTGKKAKTVANMLRSSKAPNVMPGNNANRGTRKNSRGNLEKKDGMTRRQIADNIKNLYNNKLFNK